MVKTSKKGNKSISIEIEKLDESKLYIEPYIYVEHATRILCQLKDCIKLYLGVSFIAICLLGIICFLGCPHYNYKDCVGLYWSIGVKHGDKCMLALAEIIIRDCVGGMVIGKMVADMMAPNNPIEFAEFCVDNGETIKFRYWIMLPVGEMMYEPTIRIQLLRNHELYTGNGQLKSEMDYQEKYIAIRGVRSISITDALQYNIIKKNFQDEQACELYLTITGMLKDGRKFFSRKQYTMGSILKADDFVSVRGSELQNGNVAETPKLSGNQQLWGLVKLPEMMYLHFNMACKSDTNGDRTYFAYCTRKNRNKPQSNTTVYKEIDEFWYDWENRQKQKIFQNIINRIMNRLQCKAFARSRL